MPAGQASPTKNNSKVAASQPSPKRAREHRSDDGATILPNVEHFVGLLRKVKRPSLMVQLLEHASASKLPELTALADAAKEKLPVEVHQSFFHAVAKLEASAQQTIERAAERVMLLDDDYGAQAVLSLLDEGREDDAAVLAMPSDRYSRALYLCLLQEYPVQGARRDDRFDQAESRQQMHRQWKNDQFSSHYLGPKDVEPKMGKDVQDVLRTRIAELFPKVPKDQILIEQFTRRDLSQKKDDEDDVGDDKSALLYTITATLNGSTAHYQQVENKQVNDHEVDAAMSACFSWEPTTGALSVFCKEREARRELATIFRDVALAHDGDIADMPMRQFDLLGFSTSKMLDWLKKDRVAGVDDISILQVSVLAVSLHEIC